MNTKQPEAFALAQKLENAPAWESQSPTIHGWNDSGKTLADAAAELRRLHSDYETLRGFFAEIVNELHHKLLSARHKLDAAQRETASLQAQLATVGVGGVGSLVSVPPECPHLIWYADQDRKPEMFVGHGARDTAMKRFHMISQHWNANLFVRIKKSSRDCPYPVADLAPAPAQHPDDAAVEKLAEAMKQKLAENGRSSGGRGTDCTQQQLSDLLRQHVEKGDVLAVANFCAFLFARGERVSAVQPKSANEMTAKRVIGAFSN